MSLAFAVFRRSFFRLDPERAHRLTLGLLALAGALPPIALLLRRTFCVSHPALEMECFGLRFANPLGLAAGFDKDGSAMHGLACLGFGHLELGTVTPQPQPGNPRPRLFRLEQDQALINRMGFPNRGAAALAKRLRRRRPAKVIVGANIGKGVNTPLDRAAEDYVAQMEAFCQLADYIAVNLSSPNTPGLRTLQTAGYLADLLRQLGEARQGMVSAGERRVPLLVKLSPDLGARELERSLAVILEAGMDGVIATNTTTSRDGLRSAHHAETGGLSGAPLQRRSTEMIRRLHQITGGTLPIIGAGGIFGAGEAREKLTNGAQLVQLYSGLVYRGPGVVREILTGLVERESKSGFPVFREAA